MKGFGFDPLPTSLNKWPDVRSNSFLINPKIFRTLSCTIHIMGYLETNYQNISCFMCYVSFIVFQISCFRLSCRFLNCALLRDLIRKYISKDIQLLICKVLFNNNNLNYTCICYQADQRTFYLIIFQLNLISPTNTT